MVWATVAGLAASKIAGKGMGGGMPSLQLKLDSSSKATSSAGQISSGGTINSGVDDNTMLIIGGIALFAIVLLGTR